MAACLRRRLCKFRSNWLSYDDFFMWLAPVKYDRHKAYCTLCKKAFNVSHGGVNDVKAHSKQKGHTLLRKQRVKKKSTEPNFKPGSSLDTTNITYNLKNEELEEVVTESSDPPPHEESGVLWPNPNPPSASFLGEAIHLLPGSIDSLASPLGLSCEAEVIASAEMNHMTNSKMSAQEYCLRWKYHHNNLQVMFSQLLERECYTDVTLACEGKTLRAHKMVLSACSTYFDTIFSEYAEKNPIVILKDVKYMDMKALVNFMYRGEINVHNSHLSSLLKTAEDLRIKGLAQMSWPDGTTDTTKEEKTPGNGRDSQWKPRSDDTNVPQISQVTSVANGSESPANKRRRPNSYSPKMASETGEQSQWDNDNESEPEIISGDAVPSDPGDRNYGSMLPHSTSLQQDAFSDHQEDSDIMYDDSANHPVPEPQPTMETPGPPPPPPPLSSNTPLSERFRDVIKMNDYLVSGRRPQFWEEPFTRNVMEAIKAKEIEMKAGAEILGVSYGTLYGRYREAFGCLKHPYRVRDFWSEQGPSEVLAKLQRKELSLFRAAEILNVTVTTLANYLSTLRQDDSYSSRNETRDLRDLDDGSHDGMLIGHMDESYMGGNPHLVKQEPIIAMISEEDGDSEGSHSNVV